MSLLLQEDDRFRDQSDQRATRGAPTEETGGLGVCRGPLASRPAPQPTMTLRQARHAASVGIGWAEHREPASARTLPAPGPDGSPVSWDAHPPRGVTRWSCPTRAAQGALPGAGLP